MSGTSKFADLGCEWSPTCNDCLMPECKHNVPTRVMTSINNYIGATEIIVLYNKGEHSILEMAKLLGVSERTIARAIAKHKKPIPKFIRQWLAAANIRLPKLLERTTK